MAFNFEEKLLNASKNATLIVDSLNLAFRWKHRGSLDFRYEFDKTVESLATSYGCKNLEFNFLRFPTPLCSTQKIMECCSWQNLEN